MALILADDNVITVRLNYRCDDMDDAAMNVLHYQVVDMEGAPANVTLGLSEIAEEMMSVWSEAWKAAASLDVSMISVSVTNIFPLPRSVTVSFGEAFPVVGNQATEALPMQDCPTILKKTDIGSRWGLGRLFYAGLAEGLQKNGKLTGAGLAALGDMEVMVATSVVVDGTGWGCELVPVLKRGPDDNPVSLTQIRRGVLSDFILKTQRRRRPGKGG